MGIYPLTAISLFSGAGGLDLAAKWAGIRTIAYCENDPYAQAVLMSHFRDGGLDEAPIWDEVRTFNGNPWSGFVDIVFGGFPCQDISSANRWATNIDEGERSGLWSEFYRIIREVRPPFAVVENVPAIFIRGFGRVIGDLAKIGMDCEWQCVSACSVGAPHPRERMFLVAYSNGIRWDRMDKDKKKLLPRINSQMPEKWENNSDYLRISVAWKDAIPSPGVLRVDDGLAEELDRIRLCGNGVVPQQAFPFFKRITDCFSKLS